MVLTLLEVATNAVHYVKLVTQVDALSALEALVLILLTDIA